MLGNPWLKFAAAVTMGVFFLHWMGIPLPPLVIAAGVISVPVSLLLLARAAEEGVQRRPEPRGGGNPIPPPRAG